MFPTFSKKKEQSKKKFGPDISKGMYLGASVMLKDNLGNVGEDVEPLYVDWKNLAGHLGVFGTTRVGKTRLMASMMKQCIDAGFDLLLVEPKGAEGQETIAWVLEFLEDAGRLRDFTYISPLYSELSLAFNPLYGLSNEEIASLVETLIPAKDEFYSKIGYSIVMAVLLGLDFLEKVEGEEKVKELIQEEYKKIQSEESTYDDELNKLNNPDLAERVSEPKPTEASHPSNPPYRSLVTFADLAKYTTLEGLNDILQFVQAITDEDMKNNSELNLEEMRQLKEQTIIALAEQAGKDAGYFSKVGTSFALVMQQLSTGKLGEVLCRTKVNPVMDRYRNKKQGQVVVLQPFPLKYKGASDAFVRIFFAMFTAQYGDIGATGRGLPRKIFLFIDEGGSVLYPGVEELFNKAGGLGLRICLFTQSFADLEKSIGPESATIVADNTNTKIFMKMNDPKSKKTIEDSFGTIVEAQPSYAGSKLDLRITTSGGKEKKLLTGAHVADLKSQQFLIQTQTGFYMCYGPFQPDAKYIISMPESKGEALYREIAEKFERATENTKKEEEGGKQS